MGSELMTGVNWDAFDGDKDKWYLAPIDGRTKPDWESPESCLDPRWRKDYSSHAWLAVHRADGKIAAAMCRDCQSVVWRPELDAATELASRRRWTW